MNTRHALVLVAMATPLLIAGCGSVKMSGAGDQENDRGTVVSAQMPTLGGAYELSATLRNAGATDCTYAAEVDDHLRIVGSVKAGEDADLSAPLLPLVPGVYAVRMSAGCPWTLTVSPAT